MYITIIIIILLLLLLSSFTVITVSKLWLQTYKHRHILYTMKFKKLLVVPWLRQFVASLSP